MRVAHFSDTYLPRRDGIVSSIRTLAAGLEERGHSNILFAPRYADSPLEAWLPVIGLPSIPTGVANLRLAAWPRARHVAKVEAERPDLVHVHTPGPAGLLGILAARRLGLPLVQTYHTDMHAYVDAYRIPTRALQVGLFAYRRRLGARRERVARPPRAARRRVLMDRTNGLLLSNTDVLVLPTHAVLDRTNVPVDSVRVIPTGVAPLAVTPGAGPQFRARHGIAPHAKLVLFVGRVNREKNVELLLAAFARMSDPDARLVLVGACYERGWLERLLTAHRIADRVVLAGEVPSTVVAQAYAAADVFAFPSLTETQGLVVQEAALAGVPVVLCDKQLNAAGPLAGTGICARPTPDSLAAELSHVLAHPERAAEHVRAARAAALRHTPERYALAMEEAYLHALGRRQGSPALAA